MLCSVTVNMVLQLPMEDKRGHSVKTLGTAVIKCMLFTSACFSLTID